MKCSCETHLTISLFIFPPPLEYVNEGFVLIQCKVFLVISETYRVSQKASASEFRLATRFERPCMEKCSIGELYMISFIAVSGETNSGAARHLPTF